MEFKLSFKMDNAAFSDYPKTEVERILRGVAKLVVNGSVGGNVHDYNGNRVGSFEIIED